MPEPMLHAALTPDLVMSILGEKGQNAELVEGPGGAPLLRALSAGVSYGLYFGNPALNEETKGYADAVFQASFIVQGEMPLELLNQWNANRRFARLFVAENTLYLIMDVIAYGGLTDDCVRAFIEIWDQLVPEALLFLREELPNYVKSSPAKTTS